jgi:8-oxo-dGTP pyrophosphatase MutT (NUDIX family)
MDILKNDMEPIIRTEDKREVSCFIPYKRIGKKFSFYLQKRAEDAKRLSGMIGMFGGGLDEGEDRDTAFFREVQEELTYEPKQSVYFSRYEITTAVLHVYIEEVGEDFESLVKVEEGDYGKFFSYDEVHAHPKVTLLVKVVTEQMRDVLNVEP